MFAGRLLAISLAVSGLVLAQPSVTTIQDTVYKADGTRFTGTAVINWNTFDAGDTSKIGMQSLSVPITNGALYVQLVPNTNAVPANVYTVHYNSDGVEQFTETWSVPSSAVTLRVRDVRVDPNATTGTGGSTGTPPIAETQVNGLPADLVLRPVKGAGYSPGRSAAINDAGEIESVAGSPTDCVRVNGTAAACFDTTVLATFVDAETPTGAVDGANTSFTLANPPVPPTSLQLFRNGIYQTAGPDFTLTGANIQFFAAATPQQGDTLLASYRQGGTKATSAQQLNTTYPLLGGGSLQNTLTLSLADSAFLRRGHRAMVLGDNFAGAGASWAVPPNWFAQAAVQSRSAIRYGGNAGIAGDTTRNMLARLATDVIGKNPDKVFIAAGASDIAAQLQVSAIVANINSIVNALKAANILPILCTIPPVPRFVAATAQFNVQLQGIANLQGVPLIDFSSVLVDSTTGALRSGYGSDTANLAVPANRLLASAVITALAGLFDNTYPWLPTSDFDGVNLIPDSLFQRNPSLWTATLISGSVPLQPSLATDSAFAGYAAALVKTDRASTNNLKHAPITSGFRPGDRIAFTGRIKSTGCESGSLAVDAGLQFSPGINVFYPMFHWQTDIRDGQWYAETVVPNGVTSITPFLQLNQGTGTVVVAQIGVINLTALGL
ncbi:MAG: GDSL-type esterase/lipase family protein [Acidobacteriota bacterium]|nr:GDSL-type esterase/lipase family protein [Acidobacteriota bacterium]